jgi:hypothetical protein
VAHGAGTETVPAASVASAPKRGAVPVSVKFRAKNVGAGGSCGGADVPGWTYWLRTCHGKSRRGVDGEVTENSEVNIWEG